MTHLIKISRVRKNQPLALACGLLLTMLPCRTNLLAETATASPSPRFALILLPPLSGHKHSVATDLNNNGSIVGFSFSEREQRNTAVQWKDGRATALPIPADCVECVATGINDGGTICGFGSFHTGDWHCRIRDVPFVWTKGRRKTLPLPGAGSGYADGINNAGTIAGTFEPPWPLIRRNRRVQYYEPHRKPIFWDAQEIVHSVPMPYDDDYMTESINNAPESQMVITDYRPPRSKETGQRPFSETYIYSIKSDGSGTLQNLSNYKHFNDTGMAVGNEWISDTLSHAYARYRGKTTDLAKLPNYPLQYPGSLNNSGVIVGSVARVNKAGEREERASLWVGNKVFDLNTLTHIPDSWTLISADKINDRGQIIGVAQKGPLKKGQFTKRAFLLTLTPPQFDRP